MKMNMRLVAEILLVAAFASIALTNAATYTVGGTGARWTIPTTIGAYNTWAATTNFTVGDILVFDFATNAHDVATVTKLNYDDCDDDLPIALVRTGPASINLTTAGMNYFICTIGDHCDNGQKLAVNVTAATSGSSSPPPPSSTPSPPGTTTSPPPSSTPSPPGTTTSPPPPSTTGSMSPPPPTTGSTSPPPPTTGGGSNSAAGLASGCFFAGLAVVGMMMV